MPVVDNFIADLKDCVKEVKANPPAKEKQGNMVALYGSFPLHNYHIGLELTGPSIMILTLDSSSLSMVLILLGFAVGQPPSSPLRHDMMNALFGPADPFCHHDLFRRANVTFLHGFPDWVINVDRLL